MKSIVTINCVIPTVDDYAAYSSGTSLRDFDIAVFDPGFPVLDRIPFSGGGSCVSIECSERTATAMRHWSSELSNALSAGKTVFIVLDKLREEKFASGSQMTGRNQRTYNTQSAHNYGAIPAKLDLENAKGSKIVVTDNAFLALYKALDQIMHYRVVLTGKSGRQIFATRDGATVGAILDFDNFKGKMVLIPYFDFDVDEFGEEVDGDAVWTAEALQISRAFVSQLVAIDRQLRSESAKTPPPPWMDAVAMPAAMSAIDELIADIDTKLGELRDQREDRVIARDALAEYSCLLYETGPTLEQAIEKALHLLGFSAGTLRIGDLEIDHVIVGPSGLRMIGESEGKDKSAVDISKFRQLESNIGEDFERDEVEEPAKGLLFGNGYRLEAPDSRPEQFTTKCLTNAKRLGSALIRTMDLYKVAAHLIDHPEDEAFKAACRAAIEETVGGIVEFPSPT